MAIAKKRTVKKSADSIRKSSAKKGIGAKDAWDVFTIDLSDLLNEISKNINTPSKKSKKAKSRKSTAARPTRKASSARKASPARKKLAAKKSRAKVRA